MKSNTSKSSITLPADELRIVERLRKQLKLSTKVEVVRRGLELLQNQTERERLREAYRHASMAVRPSLDKELAELDALCAEGIE